MTLSLAPEKQWQRVFNINSGSVRKQILLDKAKALFGTAYGGMQITANPWFPVKSSNASAVVTGSNWSTTADLTRGATTGTARSWMLMQNAAGAQWLWDYRGSDDATVFVSMSPSGAFSGGTTTAVPTAADALNFSAIGLYDILNAGDVYQNIWHSPDGKQTMIATLHHGTSSTFWLFGNPDDLPSDVTRPSIMWVDATTNDQIGSTFANHLCGFSGGAHILAEATPGVSADLHFIGEAIDVTIIGGGLGGLIGVKNELSSQWDIYDKRFLTSLGETTWGQFGYWADLYVNHIPQTGGLTGDHFPDTATRQWVKFNDLILWWGGATAMVVPA